MESNLTKFNTQLDNFLTELRELFPNEIKIRVVQDKLKMLRSMSSRIIIEHFHQHVLPFQAQIMNQDESFFMHNAEQLIHTKYDENQQIIQETGSDISKNDVMKAFQIIKEIWSNQLTEDNKQIIWNYFKVMVVLCKRYYRLE
jgi:GTPase SAR1 family protein